MKSARVKGNFPQYAENDRSGRFNPKLPASGRNPSARRKTKSAIDPEAFSEQSSPRFNPKGF